METHFSSPFTVNESNWLVTDHFASVFHQQVKWCSYLLSICFSSSPRQSLHNITTALYHTPVLKRTNCSHKAQGVYSDKISLRDALENKFPPENNGVQALCITLKHSGKWKRIQNSLTIKAKIWKPPLSLKSQWQWNTLLTATGWSPLASRIQLPGTFQWLYTCYYNSTQNPKHILTYFYI